jgi:hypothetical protein
MVTATFLEFEIRRVGCHRIVVAELSKRLHKRGDVVEPAKQF